MWVDHITERWGPFLGRDPLGPPVGAGLSTAFSTVDRPAATRCHDPSQKRSRRGGVARWSWLSGVAVYEQKRDGFHDSRDGAT